MPTPTSFCPIIKLFNAPLTDAESAFIAGHVCPNCLLAAPCAAYSAQLPNPFDNDDCDDCDDNR